MLRYDTSFNTEDPVEIELWAIRKGGYWEVNGHKRGHGLAYHHRAFQTLIMPKKQWHRWNELTLPYLVDPYYTLVALAGRASSGKTHEAAFTALATWCANPYETTVLISTTDTRSLELRIFGEIKKLWSLARERSDIIPGRLISSRQAIIADTEDDDAPDWRSAIIGIPCVVSGTFTGIGKFAGVKNRHVLLIADEASLMSDAYSKGIKSLKANPGFRCYALANPKDRHDVFGKLCEPSNEEGGWSRADNIEKTTVWNTRYAQGVCINLVGTDSPNHDPPLNRYTEFMPSVESVEESAAYYGKDSALFLMFDKGVFPKDGQSKRVLTRSECEKFRAQEDVVWEMGPTMKVVALDAAYGAVGGDRCPLIELHAGMCVDGVRRVAVANGPVIVPVRANISELPEDQIVKFTREYCEARDIQPHQVIFDGTGRSSLTSRFGQLWSSDVVAVEFGGRPSDRPVDGKLRSGPRQTDPLKTCREAYVDFVTELWMLLRVLVLADQFRQLPTEVLEELCMRVWDFQAARAITPNKTKVYVETKADMKLRFGRSPDLADATVAGLEGMRRLGFEPGGTVIQSSNLNDVLEDMVKAQRKLRERYALA